MRTRGLILGTLIGAALLGSYLTNGEYLFTMGRSMQVGEGAHTCLQLLDFLPDDIGGDMTYLVFINTTLTLRWGEGEPPIEYVYSVVGSTQNHKECWVTTGPSSQVSSYGDRYKATTSATLAYVTQDGTNVEERLFEKETDIQVYGESPMVTLIQTDKPIYKPGQTVKFRVMTLDYNFNPDTDGYTQISVESPNGMRVKQWDDVAAPKGLVSLEFELSAEPILGEWKIKVDGDFGTRIQMFKVDEYVLPKFEVTITQPSYLLPTTSKITGTVCAKYTYGQPVKGRMTLAVSYGSMYDAEKRPNTSISEEIDGCYKFYVDADDIQLANKSYPLYGSLTLSASVIEDGTGIELSKESVGPTLSMNPIKIKVEDDMNGFFKPGFPYKGRVIVTNPDGSPAIGEEIEVAGYYDGQKKYSKIFQSDAAGMIYFVLNSLPNDIAQLRVIASSTVYNKPRGYIPPFWRYDIYVGEGFKNVRRWYSPSDSYIYIPDSQEKLECGSEVDLDVFFTAKTAEEFTFEVLVKSGEKLLQEKQVKREYDGPIVDLNLLAVNPDHVLDVYVAPPTTARPTENPEIANFTTYDMTAYAHYEAIKKRAAQHDVPYRPKRESPLSSFVDHVTVPIQITEEMSPSAKVLVYYMKEDGEIVAASTELKIKSCFRNKASMKFNKNMALPGEDLEMSLTASPDSTCFVGMVDKSVNLLGGDKSMLSPEDVFEKVKTNAHRQFWHSYWQEDEDYCKSKAEDKPPLYESDYPMNVRYTTEGADASTAFRDLGMWVITDGIYMSKECTSRGMPYYMSGLSYSFGGGPSGVARIRPESVVVDDMAKSVDEGSGPVPDVAIRSFFPETWLWDAYDLGSEGEAAVTTTIPDTITEWVGNSLCVHPEDGLGVSPIQGVTAFQPFFVSLTLPYSAVRGETLPLKVTVFNYLEKCLTMELTLMESEGIEIRQAGANKRRFCLCGGDSETTTIYIIPVYIGEIDLEVTAVSLQDNGICKNVILDDQYEGVSDGVQRQLLVEAEGVPQDFTHSSYVCTQGETKEMVQQTIDFPEDMVPQSERAYISVVGDIMGPTLSNLKNLLRMPYGCGEQNMASWSPNVYVLQYLQSTNQATEELEAEAKRYMSNGYQRQMNYRHNDSSYSAFGENNYGNATGSLWLTSFVVRTMAQSAEFVTIRRGDIIRSVQWLVDKQQQDGCFPQVGKVFSSYMKGGLADGENPAGLTAFVLISLMDAQLDPEYADAIIKGFSCLDSFDINELDTYTLAVMSYAYSLHTYRENDAVLYRRSNILNELDKRKNTDVPGQIFWKREDEPEAVKPSWCWYRAPGAQVEMTAYILLAKLADGFEALTELQAIVQWLTQQRNPYGGFSSTQDTVVAIQALASFASLTYSGKETELTITASGLSFSVTPKNSLVYQTQQFSPSQGDAITATFEGSGCALIQTNLKFNIYKDLDVGPAFDVKVSAHRSSNAKRDCAQRSLSVCARYLKSNGLSNMAIAEVKMLTGWEPVESTLKELLQSQAIEKYELDKGYVQLYFDQLSSDRTCLQFDVIQETRMTPKPAKVRVYDYYEADYTRTVSYNIKTTCGTKAEIPFDNEGLNCTYMQCRETSPSLELTRSCPLCPSMLPSTTQLETIYCDAGVVYKSVVGRKGEYPIKVKANIRQKKKERIDRFLKPKMSEHCTCEVLSPPHEGRAVLFTNDYVLNKKTEELVLGDETTVFKLTKPLEHKIRKMAGKKNLCKKLARLRRKAAHKKSNRKIRSRTVRRNS